MKARMVYLRYRIPVLRWQALTLIGRPCQECIVSKVLSDIMQEHREGSSGMHVGHLSDGHRYTCRLPESSESVLEVRWCRVEKEGKDVCSNRHTSLDFLPLDHQALPRPMSTPSPATSICDNCGSCIPRWATEMNISLLDAEIVRRLQATIVPLRRRRNTLLPISRLN
jgi:hypothetical protein